MPHFVVMLKGRAVSSFDVEGDVVRIGRHPDNEVQIDNRGVSRFHTLLRKDLRTGLWTVEDQGSHNGTYVNGAKVKTSVLKKGDVIGVGQFTVSLQSDAATTAPAPGGTVSGDSISVRSSTSLHPDAREQLATEKAFLEFMDRSGQIVLTRDVCQLGAAPGLDVHLDGAPPKAIIIVRGYGGFQLINVHPSQPVTVNGLPVTDKTWLSTGMVITVGNESFTFQQGLPMTAEETMLDLEVPKNLRRPQE